MPIAFSRRAASALAAIVCCLGSAPANASTAADTADITHLIDAYHQAVVGHDAGRLAALFTGSDAAWSSVLSDRGVARVRAAKPNSPRIRAGGLAAFLTMVGAGRPQLDPQHDHLVIRSDGSIATVTFDFRFFIDGVEQNHGAESWQLVKSDDGWRIASIVYSSTPPSPSG